MTQLEWVIIGVGAVSSITKVIAASENGKRLKHIIRLLQLANEQRDENRR